MIDLAATIERVLALSRADGCIAIARRQATTNIRWANNTVTTSGVADEVSLSVVSIVGRRVASVTRTYFPPEQLEAMVRASEAACALTPDAADYMPLVAGGPASPRWTAPTAPAGIQVFEPLTPALGAMFDRARNRRVETFGYAEHAVSSLWLGSSTGLRQRHDDRIGKIEVTAKTPDFSRSSWGGTVTHDFQDVDPLVLFETLARRLEWSKRRLDLAAGPYEVILEPSCTADMGIALSMFLARREADEGRSPFSRAGGGTRVGEHLFGGVTIYSDPGEPGIGCQPFHTGVESSSATSVFDNGLPIDRTDWVRDGRLAALVTPRYWAARAGAGAAVPVADNLIVAGDGATMEEMIAETERALLVTCLWYMRTVDPQTALLTGLTRDGVFLVERGQVKGAVNNFRWNMSPIATFAHATQIGRSQLALPREHDEFLRAKAPPLRIERFNMSSVSEAN